MPTAAVTYNFVPETTILASEANTNFANLVNFLNSNVIQKDASLAFTNIPSGPASDPSSANQFTRKAYVDAAITTGVATAVKVIAHDNSTSSGTSIGQNFTNISGLSITHTFVAGRLYRFTGQSSFKMRSGGTGYLLSILESGGEVRRIAADLNYTGQSGMTAFGTYLTSSLSGAHTFTLAMRTNVGELDFLGEGAYSHTFTLEDLGVAP